MIKNFVFDFGNVMVHFDPKYMVGCYVSDEHDAELLEKVIFDRLYWDKLDAGTISNSEVIAECQRRLPERLWSVTEQIYYNWIYNIPEIEGMSALTSQIKASGAPLYLLSNISEYFAAHANEIPCLAVFDKCIFSAVCKKVKPSREMFEYLCKECGILPEETLFIDDSPANIAGAEAYGIRGYLFDGDVEALRRYIESEIYQRN